MIEITPSFSFDDSELLFNYVRATGPGGQNVNKVATSVQLRLDVRNSPSLPEEVKTRLVRLGGSRMTAAGVLIIEARRYRTQEQNRTDAVQRLITLLHKASQVQTVRRATRPSLSAKAERVDDKKKRSETKQRRRINPKDLE
jgi:ribosome-associated protein